MSRVSSHRFLAKSTMDSDNGGIPMNSTLYQAVTGAVVTFGVGVALVISSFGSVSNAEARIRGPRNTEQQQICGWIQDQFDLWWDRYVASPLDSAEEAEAL